MTDKDPIAAILDDLVDAPTKLTKEGQLMTTPTNPISFTCPNPAGVTRRPPMPP